MPDTTNKLDETELEDDDTLGSDSTIIQEEEEGKEEALETRDAPLIAIDEAIASLRFDEPMPPWAPYDPKTNFQLL